jgi:N,N'-diacetylchitobiose transport system permease protein
MPSTAPVDPGHSQTTTPDPAAGTRVVRQRRGPRWTPYLLLIPVLAVLAGGLGYPLIWQAITSLQKFGLAQQFGQPPEFVGLGNYISVLTGDELGPVVLRSIAFCLVNAFLTVGIGVLLALLMKAVHPVVRIVLQVALLLAWAMPMIAAVTVWKWLFDWRTGVINWLLVQMGLDYDQHNWLANPLSFFFVATVIIVWMSVPFVALSVYAALTQVSDEVLEAARIDGAGPSRILWHITMPLIRPVLSIVLLLQIIWDLRVFAQIRLLQDAGAPVGETNLLGNFIFELGVGRQDFAAAAAVSILVLALTILLSWPYVRSLLKEDAA